jgi:predicted ATPase
MLDKIKIRNYRCYDNHEIDLKKLSVIVGKNNAGKSTLVESLRLVSIAMSRFQSVIYRNPPSWTELPLRARGINLSFENLGLNPENIFHKYGSAPSIIIASFTNRQEVTIYIGENAEVFCTLKDSTGDYVQAKGQATKLDLAQVSILPPISPIRREERILGRDYVRQNISSDLASIHFRNQLAILYQYFPRFTQMAEQSWPGLRIRELEGRNGMPGEKLSLLVQDSGFVAEVGWMGSGLQMWLQIIWFLSRTNENDVVILDEPDVYMHPDLQRKLIRLHKDTFKQIIVSTHSVEIISEVEPDNILIIDKDRDRSLFATKIPVVQRILNSIGSIHNLQLTRLWASKRLLIVEGEDVALLKRLQNKLFPKSEEPFDAIPNFDIGGWGGWNYAKGSSLLLRETVDDKIKIYCLFDSDYHTNNEKESRMKEAKTLGVEGHIWSKKEIENYFVVPTAILRIITKESKKHTTITVSDVEQQIQIILKKNEESIVLNFATEIQNENRKLSVNTAFKEAKKYIDKLENRISGKELISELSKWTQENFKVTLNPIKLVQELEVNEIDKEVIKIVTKIEKGEKFKE